MRLASIVRKTEDTDISVDLNLDGSGTFTADMPTVFFKNMLAQIAKHGLFDMQLHVVGDTDIDGHHSVEDTGTVLGQSFSHALGEKNGINRYGNAMIPLNDALVLCSIDLSGKPYLHFDVNFTTPRLGDMDTELVQEFFRAISIHGGMTLHIKVLHGENNHHIAEAIFKAFGKALCEAVSIGG
ncbi:MAG: imidazoleglycerol-phosphate dehydratase HisB [Defluviitaleaceae bacterium]|nr:imidazoleglycerol-phosphate dehydratase HisB [Defluviitaleaceae bacterium]